MRNYCQAVLQKCEIILLRTVPGFDMGWNMVERDYYSAYQLAEEVGLSARRIQQLSPMLCGAGHASKVGGVVIYFPSAIDFIKNRQENRGRPPKNKS